MNPRFARSARLRAVALAALCALLGSSPVRAEPAAGRPGASDRATTAEARRHFQQGRKLLEAGAYAEAIAEFEIALSLKPSPELLFNIAQAHRLKGDTKQALEIYKRFIELLPTGPIADEARGHIAALTRQIEDDERAAQAREAEQQRQDAERQRQEVERQRQDAERQRQEVEQHRREAERQREDADRQQHEIWREEQEHRRRTGVIAVTAGGALIIIGTIVGASFGNAASGGHENVADTIGITSIIVGLFGLIPYGTAKIVYNPDLGPFKPTPAPPPSKGVAFTFSF